MLIGKHLAGKEDKVFDKISVSFPCFNDWYRDNEIQVDCEDDFTSTFKTTKNRKNPKKIQLNEKTTLTLNGYSGSYHINRHSRCLYEESYIALENTEKSKLFDLLVDIGWFKDFYSFTAMTAMPFSEIYLYNNDDYDIVDDIHYPPNPVRLIFETEEKFEIKDKFSFHHFLFDFKKIENNFSAIMEKWYEKKEKSEPIIQQLIYSVTYRRFIKSSDFLFVIQAIDGYYCRFIDSEEKKLGTILGNLYEIYKDVQIVCKNKPALNQVIDSRHYYSHLVPDGKKENVCKGWDLYSLAERLKPLLISCILTLIGFENEGINEFLSKYYERNGNNFLKSN